MTKKEMTKKELTIENENLKQIILDLQVQVNTKKDGRKSQVLDYLKSHKLSTILDISKSLNISTKNVSSQLTYLRSDGFQIFTDNNGKKFLFENLENSENQKESKYSEFSDLKKSLK